MNRFEYPVLLTPDQGGGFVVTSRDLPEVITQGETIENALFEAADALDEAFAARIDDGLAIPPPSPLQAGEYWVGPPVETAIKAGLYLALRESRISKSELARRLGVNEKRYGGCSIRIMCPNCRVWLRPFRHWVSAW